MSIFPVATSLQSAGASDSLQVSTFSQTVNGLPPWAGNGSQGPTGAVQGVGVWSQGAPAPGPLDAKHIDTQSNLGWEACTSPVTYTVSAALRDSLCQEWLNYCLAG